MKFPGYVAFFGFLLLGGSIFPAMGQSPSFADHVVINEIDINPPGDDSKSVTEWVELYNPTNEPVNIGGWSIASTTVLKKTLTIPTGTVIKPNGFLTYSYTSVWFTDVSELVQLRNADGVVIDQTPSISDLGNDFNSWQRIYDGLDTDASSDWQFKLSNAGSSNGKFTTQTEKEKTAITISVDKDNYNFQETVVISGQVSKQLFIEKPTFQPEKIFVTITGPNSYEKSITLFPDLLLKFKTSLSIQQVLGFKEGIYNVVAKYGDATTSAQFSVGKEVIISDYIQQRELIISTDKESYIPGETAKILGSTNEIIPLAGLKFKVLNPNGKQVFDGTLYPNSKGEFSTSIFMTTVNPVFGFHQLIAEYATHSAISSFELISDIKENKPISLTTDKIAYGLGDTVVITGRLNNLWIFSLDLLIQQTGFGTQASNAASILKIQDSVRLEGDSTFKYEFKIPNNVNRYGDYKVTVSKDVGTESIVFHVVENPEEFVKSSVPFTVKTDKSNYEVGDTIIISGKVNQPKTSTSFQSPTIAISIKNVDTGTVSSTTSKPSGNKPQSVSYSLTAVPDAIGNFQVKDTLYNAIYNEGTYVLTASYADGFLKGSTTFTVIDPLKTKTMSASLDKQVYGLNEQIHLTGIVPTAGSGNAGLDIVITKPNGDTDKFGTIIDNNRFSWTWTTPQSEKTNVVQNDRSKYSSNFGVYKLSVKQATNPAVILFFKVSPNPSEDSLNISPLTVTTERPVYKAGEKLKVTGTALTRIQGTEGLVVPDRVDIQIKSPKGKVVTESSVFFDAGGNFGSTFDMPVTVFTEGTYKVTAVYQNIRADNFFQVDNDYIVSSDDKLSLIISTDKEEYYPGDIATITARPSKMIFLETIEVGVPTQAQTSLNCGAFVCGIGVPITTLRPDPTGTFVYKHTFPSKSGLEKYVITFNTEFGKFTKPIQLIEKPEPVTPISFGERVTEKFNRITDSQIQITVGEKIINEKQLSPRTIQGSLFTPMRGQEANVNLKVSTSDGICVIGQDLECLVRDSTRLPGSIYQTVEINGIQYDVRYTGPDVTLEKFSILPEDSETVIPDSTWDVKVIKDQQSSQLYYKVTYVTIE